MPKRRRVPYRLDKRVVPSVTTIIGRFKDSGALLYWANKIGREGLTLAEGQDPGANAGTLAHKYIEYYIQTNMDPVTLQHDQDESELAHLAYNAFINFKLWKQNSKITFHETEVRLVSKEGFGGTIDAIASRDGSDELFIVDFKTGKIYSDHLLQVAAYGALWNEHHPDRPVGREVHILSFKRDTGDFAHHCYTGMDHELQVFRTMLGLYEDVKRIEKRT